MAVMAYVEKSKLQSVLNTYGIVLIIWALYRFYFSGSPEWFDEFIAKPVVFLLPAIYFIKRVEKGKVFESLSIRFKNISLDLILGAGIGAIFISSALFANYLRFTELNFSQIFEGKNILFAAILTVATAISEELFARGFLLKRINQEWNNTYSSSFFLSILFLFLHIPILLTNAQLSGNLLLLFFATDFVLSLVNSFVFLDRKNVLAPILIHAFYNLAILLYL